MSAVATLWLSAKKAKGAEFSQSERTGSMHKKMILMLMLPLLSVGTYGYTAYLRPAQPGQAKPELIPQPGRWVALEADVRIYQPNEPPMIGRYYRATDGSTRLETWMDGRPGKVVSIKNIPRSTHFTLTGAGNWISRPMRLPLAGWHPVSVRMGPDVERLPEKLQNLEVYRQHSRNDGRILVRAPELNMLAVIEQDSTTGWRKELLNIKVGEPDAALFEPPSNAPVKQFPEPSGIVVGQPGDIPPRGFTFPGGEQPAEKPGAPLESHKHESSGKKH
jgi:hypothetical protein